MWSFLLIRAHGVLFSPGEGRKEGILLWVLKRHFVFKSREKNVKHLKWRALSAQSSECSSDELHSIHSARCLCTHKLQQCTAVGSSHRPFPFACPGCFISLCIACSPCVVDECLHSHVLKNGPGWAMQHLPSLCFSAGVVGSVLGCPAVLALVRGSCRRHWSERGLGGTVRFCHSNSVMSFDTEVQRMFCSLRQRAELGAQCKAWSCCVVCLTDQCQWSSFLLLAIIWTMIYHTSDTSAVYGEWVPFCVQNW